MGPDFFGLCEANNADYWVVEYLREMNLRDILRATPEDYAYTTRQNLMIQIATGMQYLVDNDVVHGNLACRNILLVDGSNIKICDYGMGPSVLGAEGTLQAGLSRWAAIEVLQKTECTSKSDVWSFGITLWEILESGKTPYEHLSDTQVSERVQRGERLPTPENCVPELAQLMTRCWSVNQLDRPRFIDLHKELNFVKSKEVTYVDTKELFNRMSKVPEPKTEGNRTGSGHYANFAIINKTNSDRKNT